MGIEKANLKISIATNIGADLEDQLEGTVKAANELSGAAVALSQAATKVPRDVSAKVDAAVKEGAFEDGMGALEVAGLIKKYLVKVGDYLNHMSDNELKKCNAQLGVADGIKKSMDIVNGVRAEEEKKIHRFLAMGESDDESVGVSGAEVADPRSVAEVARAEHGTLAERKSAEAKKVVKKKKVAKKKIAKKKVAKKTKVAKKKN